MNIKPPLGTWKYYEEQTEIKHEVFKDYFDKWVKIVGKYSELVYIDGFGGKGAYKKNQEIYYGSPVLAAQIATSNKTKLGREVHIVVIDEDNSNLDNIKKIFEYEKISLNPILINGDFDKQINSFLGQLGGVFPTFVFVDPFGFKIKYTTLKRIMSFRKSEILLTFMFNAVNRFLIPEFADTLTELFGTDKWKSIVNLHGEEREKAIVDLYRNQLKKFSNFVFPYRLKFPHKDRTYYYLFHLTNYYKAASIMKSSFAKHNFGNVEYVGRRGGYATLFDMSKLKLGDVKNYLFNKYRGRYIEYVRLLEENIDETPYLESAIKDGLESLEKDGLVYIERFPKITEERYLLRKGIKDQDIIYFDIFPSIQRKSLLYETKVEYGNFTINHIFGCSHGCQYPCYASMLAKRYGKIKEEEEWLHPKIVSNTLELLDNEIPKIKDKVDFVHLSFTTDPFMYDYLNQRTYPQIERLTLSIIKKLNENIIKCTVLTKGLLSSELADKNRFSPENEYGITLVSLNENFKKHYEPWSALFDERIKALKFLHDNGLKTWVSIEPYPTPNIVKQNIEDILKEISFVDKVIFGKLNYNVHSAKFENNKTFYEECAQKVIDFCKRNNIKYHIKQGTSAKYSEPTEEIFK